MSDNPRPDGRRPDQLRPIVFQRGFTRLAPGSVLISMGETRVLCTACFEQGVPEWMAGKGVGWLTAEYDMLPASTGMRRARNRGGKIDGRTQEIQRLIGRCLRTVVDRKLLGENTIWLDCDVIQADGGTRTAGISGAFVALCDAVNWAISTGKLTASPITDSVAAISVGKFNGRVVVDLNYAEDSRAEVDFNIAMTGRGQFVEVQGSAEAGTFDLSEMQSMVSAATIAIEEVKRRQMAALE